jgi:plastocyanin
MRKLLFALIALLTVLGGAAALAAALPQAGVIRADDDDCDSSGPGNTCNDDTDDDRDDGNRGHGGGDEEDDRAAQTTPAQPAGAHEIRIVDERYTPNTITIQVGQTVTFVNADDDEHTATGPGFDTGTMLPGDSVTVTFDKPGTFDFVCQFHPEMRGQVIVEGNGSPVASPLASPAPDTTAIPVTQTAGRQVEMNVVDFAFEQPALTIPPGTTVTWTNTGAAPHTVTGLPEDSGTIDPGQSFSFTFPEVGTFDYKCAFHPQMTGQVIVDASTPPPGG